jgi:hypothetical protein
MGTPTFGVLPNLQRPMRGLAALAALCAVFALAGPAGSPLAERAEAAGPDGAKKGDRGAQALRGPAEGRGKKARRAGRDGAHRRRGKAGARRLRVHARRSLGRANRVTPPRSPDGLLFNGEEVTDFPLNQSAPAAVAPAPDPTGAGTSAMKMTVAESDVYPVTPTSNPRAQLLSPSIIDPGEEIWWSSRFYLPPDFPGSVPGWVTIVEGPYGAPFEGSPPFHLEINGDELRWQRNSTYDWDIPWSASLVRGKWIEVVLHQRFASDGFVEMWVDGQPVTFFGSDSHNPNGVAPTQHLQMQTLDASNGGGANFVAIQNYREAGMFDSVTVLHGPLRIGTSRAAIEG